LTRRSEDLLRERGVGWVETESRRISLRLPRLVLEVGGRYSDDAVAVQEIRAVDSLRPAYLLREDKPYTANLFANQALRVVRWLLIDPQREWRVTEMAAQAGLNKPTVSRVFDSLERNAYIKREPRGPARVVDPVGLLKDWASAPPPMEELSMDLVTLESTVEFRKRLRQVLSDGQYAWTAEVGAELLAPFARVQKLEAYLETQRVDMERLLDDLKLRPTTRGANVRLILGERGTMDGSFDVIGPEGETWCVSRPQLYVDLWKRGELDRQAADFLLERGQIWPGTSIHLMNQ
jgi:AraC-like DNA-binding protein